MKFKGDGSNDVESVRSLYKCIQVTVSFSVFCHFSLPNKIEISFVFIEVRIMIFILK